MRWKPSVDSVRWTRPRFWIISRRSRSGSTSRIAARNWAGREWIPEVRRRVNRGRIMAKWAQYELWVQVSEKKWEMVGVFPDAELPTSLARSRARRARVIEVKYDGSKMVSQEI